MIQIIDTFVDFKKCFQNNLNISIEEKINLWQNSYINKYPELEQKCKNDYSNCGFNWRDIARTKVFNNTKDDFIKMLDAYQNINTVMDSINFKVNEIFNVELDLNIVLYCGLCNSAGWVSTYNGVRAILYGIDKIAELNWHTIDKIQPLIAHELCHAIHYKIRGEDKLNLKEINNYNNGIWTIYSEGFAQFYQQSLIDNLVDCRGEEWMEKCSLNKNELKSLYYAALSNNTAGTKAFFGDWFKVLDISDTGYYLGAEFIKEISEIYNMEHIATLKFQEIEIEVMRFLTNKL